MTEIHPASADERAWVAQRLNELWASTTVVSRGWTHDASELPAFVASSGAEPVGLATYRIEAAECELVTLDAFRRGEGVGTALLHRVASEAAAQRCHRLWLITSNDNLDALRFYQRRGLRLVAVHRGAIDAARRLKPEIPEVGDHGIPIHDELELELALPAAAG